MLGRWPLTLNFDLKVKFLWQFRVRAVTVLYYEIRFWYKFGIYVDHIKAMYPIPWYVTFNFDLKVILLFSLLQVRVRAVTVLSDEIGF